MWLGVESGSAHRMCGTAGPGMRPPCRTRPPLGEGRPAPGEGGAGKSWTLRPDGPIQPTGASERVCIARGVPHITVSVSHQLLVAGPGHSC
jgi:hypothetical protein